LRMTWTKAATKAIRPTLKSAGSP